MTVERFVWTSRLFLYHMSLSMTIPFRTASRSFSINASVPKERFKQLRSRLATEISPDVSSLEYFDPSGVFIDDSSPVRQIQLPRDSFIYGVERPPLRVSVQRKLAAISIPCASAFLTVRLQHKQEYKPAHVLPPERENWKIGPESGVHAFGSAAMYITFQTDWGESIDDILNRVTYFDLELSELIDQRRRRLVEMLGCWFGWRHDDVGVFVLPHAHDGDLPYLLIDVAQEDLPGLFEIYCQCGYIGIETLLAIYARSECNLHRTKYQASLLAGAIEE
jgi:hypothetical protein